MSDSEGNRQSVGNGRLPELGPKRALAGVLAGKGKVEACLDAGYSESTAATQSSRILRRAQGELCAALERRGLTVDKFAETLDEGVHATQVVFHEGELIAEVPDYRARAQFSRIVVDVCGDGTPRQSVLQVNNTEVTYEITADDLLAAQRKAKEQLQAAHVLGPNGNGSRLSGV